MLGSQRPAAPRAWKAAHALEPTARLSRLSRLSRFSRLSRLAATPSSRWVGCAACRHATGPSRRRAASPPRRHAAGRHSSRCVRAGLPGEADASPIPSGKIQVHVHDIQVQDDDGTAQHVPQTRLCAPKIAWQVVGETGMGERGMPDVLRARWGEGGGSRPGSSRRAEHLRFRNVSLPVRAGGSLVVHPVLPFPQGPQPPDPRLLPFRMHPERKNPAHAPCTNSLMYVPACVHSARAKQFVPGMGLAAMLKMVRGRVRLARRCSTCSWGLGGWWEAGRRVGGRGGLRRWGLVVIRD